LNPASEAGAMFDGKPRSGGQVFVKICGITNEADALAAIDAGADALGFNLVRRSKRHIDIDKSGDWIATLPSEVGKVAVMADPSWEDTLRVSRLPFVTALQLHGSESSEFCRRLADVGVKFAKAVAVANSTSLKEVLDFSTDTLVLDTASSGDFGGTGKSFPWKYAEGFVRENPRFSVILAGGLNPENVKEAVRAVCPRGVDVTSGVEATPGRKDHRRMKAFVLAVGRAAR
jgi:phosphoribosylanthranilate isomerase